MEGVEILETSLFASVATLGVAASVKATTLVYDPRSMPITRDMVSTHPTWQGLHLVCFYDHRE